MPSSCRTVVALAALMLVLGTVAGAVYYSDGLRSKPAGAKPAAGEPGKPAAPPIPARAIEETTNGSEAVRWEFKAVLLDGNDQQNAEKLKQLAADGWQYVGPLGNGMAAVKRRMAGVNIARLRPGDVVPPRQWVDVLEPVDLSRDVRGTCWREGSAIRASGSGVGDHRRFGYVAIPVLVEGDYDWEVDFTRNTGTDVIEMILPVGKRLCSLYLSGWWGRCHGLQVIDGRPAPENSTTVRPGTLITGKRYRVLVSVRRSDANGLVAVSLDGKPLIHWTGESDSLSLIDTYTFLGLALPQPILVTANDVTFHRAVFRVVAGKASVTQGKAFAAEEALGSCAEPGRPQEPTTGEGVELPKPLRVPLPPPRPAPGGRR